MDLVYESDLMISHVFCCVMIYHGSNFDGMSLFLLVSVYPCTFLLQLNEVSSYAEKLDA